MTTQVSQSTPRSILELLVGLAKRNDNQAVLPMPSVQYANYAEDASTVDDSLLLARACWDNREFARCAQVLEYAAKGRAASESPEPWQSLDATSRFVRWYALYMVSRTPLSCTPQTHHPPRV